MYSRLRRRYLPAQRSFQPPHLGFAAFDHLFSPNQMAQANHTSGEENSPRLSAKNSDSSRYGGSIRSKNRRGAVRNVRSRHADLPTVLIGRPFGYGTHQLRRSNSNAGCDQWTKAR